VMGPGDMDDDPAQPPPPVPGAGPGTKVMSKTMVGEFDFLDDTPAPEQPVHEIPPPKDRSERRVLERFGFGFVYGDHDASELLAAVRQQVEEWNAPAGEDVEETRVDGAPSSISPGVPGVLLVGGPHSGQRRLSRLIALTLANAGLGDGSIRAHDAEDVRDHPAERIGRILAQPGPVVLFERLDVAIAGTRDPAALVGAVRRARRDPVNTTPVIATCEPQAYKQLLREHPKLVQAFRVHRLPDFSDLDNRMMLLHLLAEERRVTIGASAMDVAREDLSRLRGPGDLVNARLVEAYLDQAAQRNMERAGASHDRLVLTPDDLAGVAEGIEPALRPPGDIDGYLRQLEQLTGLDDVKAAVHELAEDAGLAADRARYGVAPADGRHLIFVGPPGTGKTTVAGLVGGIYAALGLLESGHVVACRPVHLAGRDRVDTENRVASMVEQALGGVLLIQDAHRLDRSPPVVAELLRRMNAGGARFMVVCSSPPAEMEGFLAGNPAFRGEFGRVVEFTGMGDRDMVRLFQSYAERDLYVLDEELRVELLNRFERLRDDPRFAYARTVRALFEQTVARQAARLAGADVNAATVARLTARDLPETALEQMLGDFRPGA
ncbi:MAG: AAA family ATPase, partial [Spirillospora sp.]